MDYLQKVTLSIEFTTMLNTPTRLLVDELDKWLETESGRSCVLQQVTPHGSKVTKIKAIDADYYAEFIG